MREIFCFYSQCLQTRMRAYQRSTERLLIRPHILFSFTRLAFPFERTNWSMYLLLFTIIYFQKLSLVTKFGSKDNAFYLKMSTICCFLIFPYLNCLQTKTIIRIQKPLLQQILVFKTLMLYGLDSICILS